jgi:hypothetical protein
MTLPATWAGRYWNRYPGAMCDTAAMIYLPLLEEMGHMPTKVRSAAEISSTRNAREAIDLSRQRAVLHDA